MKLVPAICLFIFLISCSQSDKKTTGSEDSLPDSLKHLPQNSLKGLKTTEGLEVQMMASEPILRNPTNIDVDDRGRIWVTEAFN